MIGAPGDSVIRIAAVELSPEPGHVTAPHPLTAAQTAGSL